MSLRRGNWVFSPCLASARESDVTFICLSVSSFLVTQGAVKLPYTHCTALNA